MIRKKVVLGLILCCLIVFYIGTLICGFVPPFSTKMKKCGTPKVGGVLLVLIVYFLWKIVSCFIRGGNIFSCLFR